MAQTGGILCLSKMPDPENWDTYFVKITNAKFKQKVMPGDTLVIKMELMELSVAVFVTCMALLMWAIKSSPKADMTAQIVNRTTLKNDPKYTDIHPNARIDTGVNIQNFVTIEENVVIGKNCWIGSGAVIMNGARLGRQCKNFSRRYYCRYSTDLKFDGEESLVEIGDNTTVREYVTINRGYSSRRHYPYGKIVSFRHTASHSP